nr:S8 family serine peptidase [Hydrogenophaga sp.]
PPCKGERCTTRQIVNWKDEQSLRCRITTRIGMVDTGVSPALSGVPRARLTTRRFHGNDQRSDPDHGSAVAALLAGSAETLPGLLPYAQLYAADTFTRRKDGTPVSSASYVAEALNWLVMQRVQVINISIAGPDNALLQRAIAQAIERGVTVVASAGNDGPRARPVFPAAYPGVIAVTAVDARRRLYPQANRGRYVALAAPGVAVYAPTANGGSYRTGTSFAAPFVTASAAVLRARGVDQAEAVLRGLQRSAIDLGPRGRDPLYGWGLLRAPDKCP